MTKSELIDRIAKRYTTLPVSDTRLAVDLLLKAIADAITSGRRVEIRGFGVFDVGVRPARMARNPKTGETVSVPAKAVPHFKAGKGLKDRVAYPSGLDGGP